MDEYLTSDLLFPSLQNLQKGRSGEFSVNGTTGLRTIVKEETGVDFDLRACRRTVVQVCLDQGVPLESTSRMVGHKTSKTTETYYGRVKNAKAVAEAQKVGGVAKPTLPAEPTEGRKINPP